MARVYVSLGANVEPEQNLALAIEALGQRFGEVDLSSVYRSQAVGFEGPPFLNLVAAFDTDLTPEAIVTMLRSIEDWQGRDREAPRFSSRPLDLDLLLYDEQVIHRGELQLPRGEILEQAFVLRPLAELAPDLVHPLAGRSMAMLWRDFQGDRAGIERIGDSL
jgi:2-amino-4-hydroxy-6-hydroxymethyldihydropteridine diphosphokinase